MGFYYHGKEIPTGGGASVVPGDGLSTDGGVLNVDNPVRGVLTRAEWDALTEEQKASGTYFVDDGGGSGGGSSWETYSTEEQRIGTWIDGKPLYRQVYNVRTPATVNTSSSVTVAKYPNTCQFTKINALIYQEESMAYTVIPAEFGGSNFYAGIFLQNGDLRLMAGHQNYINRPVIVILEYTKTTDQEVSA